MNSNVVRSASIVPLNLYLKPSNLSDPRTLEPSLEVELENLEQQISMMANISDIALIKLISLQKAVTEMRSVIEILGPAVSSEIDVSLRQCEDALIEKSVALTQVVIELRKNYKSLGPALGNI